MRHWGEKCQGRGATASTLMSPLPSGRCWGRGHGPTCPEGASVTHRVCSAPCKSTDLLWKVCEGSINAVYATSVSPRSTSSACQWHLQAAPDAGAALTASSSTYPSPWGPWEEQIWEHTYPRGNPGGPLSQAEAFPSPAHLRLRCGASSWPHTQPGQLPFLGRPQHRVLRQV